MKFNVYDKSDKLNQSKKGTLLDENLYYNANIFIYFPFD